MVLAKFMPDRPTPIESESHSPMKNTAKTTSSAFFKLNLQINDLVLLRLRQSRSFDEDYHI